jgi:hypothetical protein
MESSVFGYILFFIIAGGILYAGYRIYQKRKAEKAKKAP